MSLNFQKQSLTSPLPNQLREQRQGYTLTYIPTLQSLLLFGGNFSQRSSDLYLYSLASHSWSIQKSSPMNSKPIPRKFHTACYEKSVNGIIIYGGQADKNRSLDCFWLLSVDGWKWNKLAFKGTVPPPRQMHTFTSIGNGSYLIFGGITLPYQKCLHDLWLVKHIDRLKDTKTLQISGATCTEILPNNTDFRKTRYAHSAFFHSDTSTLYIIGGASDKYQQLLTVLSLNLQRNIWSKISLNVNVMQLKSTKLLRNPQQSNEIFIMGGIYGDQIIKQNTQIYSLVIQNETNIYSNSKGLSIRKLQKLSSSASSIDCICQLPFNEVIAMCSSYSSSGLSLHRVQLPQSSPEMESDLNLQQLLKYIKNEQLLSQQLIQKVSIMESLYKQFYSYSSSLYRQYLQTEVTDPLIQKQKKKQVEACMKVKQVYNIVNPLYQGNLDDLKRGRQELANINECFEGYIETERDQQHEGYE